MITQKRLRSVIIYNPCTGEFNWRTGRTKAKPGNQVGALTMHGRRTKFFYRIIKIDYKSYRTSRLAWLYCYGEWPDVIDHADGNSLNDSIWNLRNGTQTDNMRNPVSRQRMSTAAYNRYHK